MENARKSEVSRLSPGANLNSAEDQAEAAFADLINSTMDQRGITELTEEELEKIGKGGTMWEEKDTETRRKSNFFGDITNLISALSGGAHIVKNEFGET